MNKIEIKLYFFIWTGSVLYSMYKFSTESNQFFSHYKGSEHDFETGWPFLKKRKDVSDIEWSSFLYVIKSLYIFSLLQALLTDVLLHLKYVQVSKCLKITTTVIFMYFQWGEWPLVIIAFQPLIFYSVLLLNSGPGGKFMIWITSAISILLITKYKQLTVLAEFQEELNLTEESCYALTTTIFWMHLKCLSYSLDKCRIPDKNNDVLDYLAYCLYLPTLSFGPFLGNDEFSNCFVGVTTLQTIGDRLRRLLLDTTRFLFWLMFLELCLHNIYVNAAAFQPQMVVGLRSWALYGFGYAMGQYFHIKYVVMYGLSTAIAKYERIQVPGSPRCIGRVHLYSDMWKHFDQGLHNFLVRYIYIPTLKYKTITNKILSSFLCFGFVYVWHGIERNILIWTTLNFIGISLEIMFNVLNEKLFNNVMTGLRKEWIERLTCLLVSPLLAMSALSNFYFFGGVNIGDIFLMRTLNDNWINKVSLISILYCCCHVSSALKRQDKKENDKYTKNIKVKTKSCLLMNL